MTIKQFMFNPFQENTYVVYDETREAIVIDAGAYYEGEKSALKNFIDSNNLNLVRVLNTHLHIDHQFGNKFLFDTYGIAPEAHQEDEFWLDIVKKGTSPYGLSLEEDAQKLKAYIQENQEIRFGNTVLKTLHVPGHSPGHVVFYNEAENVLFAGDVLFAGSVGRSDLQGGDHATLIKGIIEKLLILPDETVVYSGHGPQTSIGREKVYNPYL